MFYFKKTDNTVWAYEYNIQSDPASANPALTLMPPAEVAAHLNPPKTKAQKVEELRVAVLKFMDETAQGRGEADMLTLCSYANSSNPVFKSEALAAYAWRDLIRAYVKQVRVDVLANVRPVPTSAQLLAELPTPTWPA